MYPILMYSMNKTQLARTRQDFFSIYFFQGCISTKENIILIGAEIISVTGNNIVSELTHK